MALFGRKKNTDEVPANGKAERAQSPVAPKKASGASSLGEALDPVILRPRITEKASFSAENGTYVFDVATTANKNNVARAIEKVYNVKPIKIRIASVPAKKKFIRGSWGTKSGGKKAYVYLKEGDKIEII